MRVLQINAVNKTASTGRTCVEISSYMNSRGHECYTAFSKGEQTEKSVCVSNPIGCKVHALFSRLTGLQGYFSSYSTRKFIRFIKKIKPEVIHLRNLHANYINLKLLLQYLADNDIATVITLHDCWFFTGKCTHYTSAQCNRWQTGCRKCPKLKDDNNSWFFDRTSKMWADKKKWLQAIPRLGIIGVSDWITDEAKKSFFENAKIITRIYDWIDSSVFYPREEDIRDEYKIPRNKFLLLCVSAGWSENSPKYRDFVELSAMLENDMQILLAGNISETINLPANVTYIGYLSSTAELAKIYSMADVYVHLSHEDTFGKVIAEALACGTPAIVYDSTACPEVVGEGCGFVVETGNVEAIKFAVDEIKRVGKKSFSQTCTAFAREKFNKEKLIEETIEVYKQLLADKK